jgi:hypothetical protein
MRLTKDKMRVLAPAVFRTREEGPADGASLKENGYQFCTTADIIEDLKKLGWSVVGVAQQNSKKNPETCKHKVVFQHKTLTGDGINVPQLILVNSHDRTSSFVFHLAILTRYERHMICGNEEYERFSIRHLGYNFDEVVRPMIEKIMLEFPKAMALIKMFEKINVKKAQQEEYIHKALVTRYTKFSDPFSEKIFTEELESTFDISEFLTPLEGNTTKNLWGLYLNVHQKLLGGDFTLMREDGRIIKARELSNIRAEIITNKAMWNMTEDFSKRVK